MAQGLIIAGQSIRVRKNSWTREPSIYQGVRVRLSENNLFDGSYAEARVWGCQAYVLSHEEEEALRAACPRGQTITISGELPGEPVDVLVDISTSNVLKIMEGGVQILHRVVTLHIEEVLDEF